MVKEIVNVERLSKLRIVAGWWRQERRQQVIGRERGLVMALVALYRVLGGLRGRILDELNSTL